MGNNKNDHKALTGDRSSKGARGMGDSESDGEDSTTHIRNEQNNIKQSKLQYDFSVRCLLARLLQWFCT